MHLLLASKSAARRAMLDAARVPYALVDSDCDEDAVKARLRATGTGAIEMAEALAHAKAAAAIAPSDALVLGSDQILECADGSTLDKPASPEDARSQLLGLSGRSHRLHSAACIVRGGITVWRHVESVTLTMRPLGEAFIDAYLAREYGHIRWSVGGYRIEGEGVQLFETIEGSHFAILGLPLLPLLAYLRETGVVAS